MSASTHAPRPHGNQTDSPCTPQPTHVRHGVTGGRMVKACMCSFVWLMAWFSLHRGFAQQHMQGTRQRAVTHLALASSVVHCHANMGMNVFSTWSTLIAKLPQEWFGFLRRGQTC